MKFKVNGKREGNYEAQCDCVIFWCISQVYKLNCKVVSPLTVTADSY